MTQNLTTPRDLADNRDASNASLPESRQAQNNNGSNNNGSNNNGSSNMDLMTQEELPLKSQNPLMAGFNKLSVLRQFGLMIGFAGTIALALMVVLWSQRDSYRPLMSSADGFATSDVIQVLDANGITFDMDPNSGMVLVRDGDLHQARLAVAAAGLTTEQMMGYELLDENQPLGTSQFMENTRYLRSLEGELGRTVAAINQIRSARVHLAIPERSVFVRDRREPSASVFADLYPGAQMDAQSVKAIRNLVASSIPELRPENVSIVDQRGRLLSDQIEEGEDGLTNKQFEYTQRVEQSLLKRIHSILSPVVGSDNFQAEVSADVDFTRTEQAEELYNPDLIALRSEQTVDEQRLGETNGGVPGALTNQPPGAATAPEEANTEEGGTQPPSTSRSEATRNYEVDRTLSYTQFQQGRLRRLTVAVVVNDLVSTDPETGEVIREPWNDADLELMRLLVQDAVGYDPSRGDSINVLNSPFRAEMADMEPPAWYTQPWFWNIAKQILAGLFVLILIFGVLRPALRNVLAQGDDKKDTEDDVLAALDVDDDAITDDKVTLSGAEEYRLPGPSESFERQLDALRGLIAEDPGRVALVLKRWVMQND